MRTLAALVCCLGLITPLTLSAQSEGRATPTPECRIKGNISTKTGERIYHLPGQRFYNQTRIDPSKGERWFCSEDDAKRAGWRKSKV